MAVNFLKNLNFLNTIGNNNANPNPCPDQLVGYFLGTTFTPISTRQNIDYISCNQISPTLNDPIVIILESPHKNEYDPITSMAIGPAMGRTGINFKNYFASKIQKSKIYQQICISQHDIVLVNSIQYQCSLGYKLNGKGAYRYKKQRDKNWLICFGNSSSNDLIKRITAINPCAIINLCTIGIRNLKQHVDNDVTSNLNKIKKKSVLYTTGDHPSTWTGGKGSIQ